MIYFDALTEADCEQIRKWRNEDISAARTPFLLTELMQKDFYEKVISNRDSEHRYWAIKVKLADGTSTYGYEGLIETYPIYSLIGIAGLTNIENENGRAEIALMIKPDERGKDYGRQAFEHIKGWGFERMRLHTIYACVYGNNPRLVEWWRSQEPTENVSYPGGKFWGEYHRTYHMTWVNKGDK